MFRTYLSLERVTLLVAVLVAGCGAGASPSTSPNSPKTEGLTQAGRDAALQRAHVWAPTNVSAMNIKTGPAGKDAFAPEATVTCDYVDKKLGGNTPKFACAVAKDDERKVKYGRDNGEVFAEVAASRLLWALGFGADGWYPVRVVCRGCPARLHGDGSGPGGVRFDFASIEVKMPGRDMVAGSHHGWAWPELDRVDPARGGAPRAQRDALKLLGVFLQHSDSKPEQQQLLCVGNKEEKRDLGQCQDTFMMLHDVGQTFGRANTFNRSTLSSVNLERWSQAPIWKDAQRCVGDIPKSMTGTLGNPVISEEGRKFLAGLLVQLTDAQLRDLFEVARFPERGGSGGSVDAWVNTFKHKRDEIVNASCPP